MSRTDEKEHAPAGRRAEGRRSRGSPLWKKAPLALVRYPGLLAAVVVGALLLSLVAAAFPLFLSRSEGELLHEGIRDPTIGRNGAGLFYSVTNVHFREKARGSRELLTDRLDEEFGRIAAEGPDLGTAIRFVLGAEALVTLPGEGNPESGPVYGRIFSGTDAEKHVEVIDGDGSNGAMVPDSIAAPLGVGPGDVIQLSGMPKLRVGGVYRALYKSPTSGYWSPWSEQIFRQCPHCPELPQFILVGPEDAVRLTRELHDPEERDLDYGWVAPIDDLSLNVDEARDVRAYAARVLGEVTDRTDAAGSSLQVLRPGLRGGAGFFSGRRDTEFRSSMPLVLREVERRAATVEGPLRLLLIAGLGVAAAVVAAAAAFAVAGRRTEAAFLHAHGWGPVPVRDEGHGRGGHPDRLGSGRSGSDRRRWLIAVFGPAGPVAPSARTVSIRGRRPPAPPAWSSSASCRASPSSGPSRCTRSKRRLAWVPWEILADRRGALVLSRLNAGGALIEDPRPGHPAAERAAPLVPGALRRRLRHARRPHRRPDLKGHVQEHERLLRAVGALDHLAGEHHVFTDLDDAVTHARLHAAGTPHDPAPLCPPSPSRLTAACTRQWPMR